jgi:hypothetical protein
VVEDLLALDPHFFLFGLFDLGEGGWEGGKEGGREGAREGGKRVDRKEGRNEGVKKQ